MKLSIKLNDTEDYMVKKLNESEGNKYSNEEWADRFFRNALYIAYDIYYKKQEEINNK